MADKDRPGKSSGRSEDLFLGKKDLARRQARERALRDIDRQQSKLDLQRRKIESLFAEDAEPEVLTRPLPRFRQAEVDAFFREYGEGGFVKRMDRVWSEHHRGHNPPRDKDDPYVRALVSTFEQDFPLDPDGVYARLLVEVGIRDGYEEEDVTDSG